MSMFTTKMVARAGAALILACALSSQAATLSLLPTVSTVTGGDTVTVDMVISGLDTGGPVSLGDFDITIDFDPGVLAFDGYALGSSLGDLMAFEAFDASFGLAAAGTINLAEVSFLAPSALDALQAGSFVLASLTFTARQVDATTGLVFASTLLGDAFGNPLVVDAAQGATITVQSIPLPAAVWLLGAALLALGRVGAVKR